ncbi:MAG: hypothetical protein AB7J35_09795 [Dehalococcoidia bacterium]
MSQNREDVRDIPTLVDQVDSDETGQGGVYIGGGALLVIVVILLLIVLL